MRDGISTWYSARHDRWILQVSFRDVSGKRRTIQRRAKSQGEAKRRAIDLSRSPALKQLQSGNLSMEQLLESYVKEQRLRVRPTSLANTVHLLNLYVLPRWAKRKIANVSPDMVEDLLDGLASSGLRVGTINTVRAKAHALFAFAVRKGHLPINPVSSVRPLSHTDSSKSQVQAPWSLQEAKSALAAFKGHHLEPFVVLALSTGMRKGEILALRWSDINFPSSTLRVQKSRGERRVMVENLRLEIQQIEGETKTRASNRTLSLSEEVVALLRELLDQRAKSGEVEQDQYLILGVNGQPISPSYLTRGFNAVLKKSGIRRIRIHDLRHTAANIALESGARLEELSQGLGHTGTEITKRTYAPAVQALSDRFVSGVSRALFQ